MKQVDTLVMRILRSKKMAKFRRVPPNVVRG